MGAECPPDNIKKCKKLAKRRGKSERGTKDEKSGRKGKSPFTFPLLTDRAGCTNVFHLRSSLPSARVSDPV